MTRKPSIAELRKRAREVAARGLFTEEEALEMLATANGYPGDDQLVDHRGRIIRLPERTLSELLEAPRRG